MILLNYRQHGNHPLLQSIGDAYPYLFLNAYHQFEEGQGTEPAFLVDEQSQVFIPVKFYKKKFFHFAQFLFQPLRNAVVLSATEEQVFFNTAIQFLKKEKGVHRIIQSLPLFCFQGAPQKSISCPFGIYSVDLTKNEEAIFSAMSESTRRQIRKTEIQGVHFAYGTDQLEVFYKLHSDTMKRERSWIDTPENIRRLYNRMSENILCGVAYINNVPEAGFLIPFTKFAAYYYYGGTANEPELPGSFKGLFWDTMKKMKALGIKKFVLGGARMGNISSTKFERIQFFKERFGPDVEKGTLWKMNLNPFMSSLYDKVLNTRMLLSGHRIVKDIIDSYHQRDNE